MDSTNCRLRRELQSSPRREFRLQSPFDAIEEIPGDSLASSLGHVTQISEHLRISIELGMRVNNHHVGILFGQFFDQARVRGICANDPMYAWRSRAIKLRDVEVALTVYGQGEIPDHEPDLVGATEFNQFAISPGVLSP